MSHKIFAISIIQKLTTAKFCRRKTQPRRQLRRQKLNAVVNSEGCMSLNTDIRVLQGGHRKEISFFQPF